MPKKITKNIMLYEGMTFVSWT